MTEIYRVVVRGQFDNLDEPTKQELEEKAPDHDFLKSAFTAGGTFTYDERLVVFNLRYELRTAAVAKDDADAAVNTDPAAKADPAIAAEAAVGAAALDLAGRWLTEAGYPHKRLRSEVTNMASMWN